MRRVLLAFAVLAVAASGRAEREPVLKQIDLPHPYYYREMYLPQLTSGPSAVAWSPDSQWVVYSLAGSLWRQRLDSSVAEQLTAGPGYDYQPDWSPDGRWIVYCSYDGEALELYALEVATGKTRQLTKGGAVNLEPRWSPDGPRLAFVSTAHNRRFHIFVGEFKEGRLESVRRLTGETRTELPRYYYSPFDHEISPTWSPDGSELIFVSNRGRLYGTGGLWRMKAEPGAEPREIYYEETTWKARPDWSPDGKRVVYSSYAGRQWHQLWLIPAEGGDAFPLSYGEYDNTGARWSRDGKHIAFISNRNGNTELWIQEVVSGKQWQLSLKERRYLKPMGRVRLVVRDTAGRPTAARVSVLGEDGRAYAPERAWIHADDSVNRPERRFEAYYFHLQEPAEIAVPAGRVTIEVLKGFEHRLERRELRVEPHAQVSHTIRLQPLPLPEDGKSQWVSGDLHVHMNYGGAYRNTPNNLVAQAAAENLGVVHNLIVNKEQRIPDVEYFSGRLDPASTSRTLLLHGQEFHTSYWGHMGLLNLTQHLLLPDYAGYPNTAAASLYPHNSLIADRAHAQGALVGYVHPFEAEPDPRGLARGQPGRAGDPGVQSARITHALPVDAALGKLDYLEVLGFSDHRATAAVWYRLLNLGFRIPAGAGTDAMANFASLRGPLGLNRVYVEVPRGPLNLGSWLQALRRGHTFATNGPLLWFSLGGRGIGDELKLPAGEHSVPFTATLRSLVPVDHLEIVCNGRVVRALALGASRDRADVSGTIPIASSSWCLLRAWSERATHPIFDIYPYATTSPVYISVDAAPPRSPEDAAYFIAWIDRVIENTLRHTDWNTEAEKQGVLEILRQARAVYEKLRE